MLKASAFVNESSHARMAGECRYYMAFALLQLLGGVLFLLIPVADLNGLFLLLAGWVLLGILTFAILRPLFYSRGIADIAMALLTGAYYALLSCALGTGTNAIAAFRLAVCVAIFFAGISRILAYARMIVIINIPLMPVCGFAEMLGSVLIFAGWPGKDASAIFWVLGMTMLLSGFESLTESAKLKQLL